MNNDSPFDLHFITTIANQLKQIVQTGVKIGVVIGGGNFFRGISNTKEFGLDRANADYIGILATIMNGVALDSLFKQSGLNTALFSALEVPSIAPVFNRNQLLEALDDNKIAIFVGGTGNPYFTTDSTAAIRALDMQANLIIKATKVDGVYNKDPLLFSDAIKYNSITFDEAIDKQLKVMDITAFDLCRSNDINIRVCNIFDHQIFTKIILERSDIGTHIY
jgi:uridylate kinase